MPSRLLGGLCSFKENKTISAQAAGGGTTANRGSREPLAQDRAKSACQAFSKVHAHPVEYEKMKISLKYLFLEKRIFNCLLQPCIAILVKIFPIVREKGVTGRGR